MSQVVKRRSLSEEVILKIRGHIIENNLRPGDRLPTEQEMADLYGVSRISVREATKALNFFGVIESAPRRGLTVGSVDMKRVADILGFHFALDDYPKEMLLKARMVIEIGCLQYSMEEISRNPDTCHRLAEMCSKLEKTEDAESFIRDDAAFHQRLVEVSGIEPLAAFNDVLQVFFARFRENLIRQRRGWAAGARVHQQIINALRDRNVSEAEDLLRRHLEVHKGI